MAWKKLFYFLMIFSITFDFLGAFCHGADATTKVTGFLLAQNMTPQIQVIMPDNLKQIIRVVDKRVGHAGAFLKVQITVKNLTNQPCGLDYQVQWLDSDHFQVQEPRPWQPFKLDPNETDIIGETALSRKAAQVIFKLRLSKNF